MTGIGIKETDPKQNWVGNIYLSHSWIKLPSMSYSFTQQIFVECLQCASHCYW